MRTQKYEPKKDENEDWKSFHNEELNRSPGRDREDNARIDPKEKFKCEELEWFGSRQGLLEEHSECGI